MSEGDFKKRIREKFIERASCDEHLLDTDIYDIADEARKDFYEALRVSYALGSDTEMKLCVMKWFGDKK